MLARPRNLSPTAVDIIGQSIAWASGAILTSRATDREYSLTTGVKSTLDDPILGCWDPNHGTNTLGCDHVHGDVHFVIRDISVFSVNNYELSERKSGVADRGRRSGWAWTHVISHL